MLIVGLGFTSLSCTRIPLQSITLSERIQEEGARMHQLNLLLINQLFAEKKERVNDFIKSDYTPSIIQKMTNDLDEDIDVQLELPQIMAAAIPMISERQYSMQMALDSVKIKIVDQLNSDFVKYNMANTEMKRLLESAVKLNEEKKQLLNQSNWFKKKGIDYDQLAELLDRFVYSSGNIGGLIMNLNKDLNKVLNQ
jgi:ABC-type ATPase with predicted acetyltransferase domain